jgi:hypothetical protein
MAVADVEVEWHPNTAKQIRDTLVGKIYQVRLLDDDSQHEGPLGFFHKVSSRIALNKIPHPSYLSAKKHRQAREPNSIVLLTVESVEVSFLLQHRFVSC